MNNRVKVFWTIIIVGMLLGACGINSKNPDDRNVGGAVYQSDEESDRTDIKVDKKETAHECTEIKNPYKTLPYTEDTEIEATYLK